jgi:hypothetical protein
MPNFPLVSIVTPSFNQAQYLEQTLRSVIEQDYPRIEYIVIDGASTDGSVEIIHKYSSRLAFWVSEKDAGQAEAINKGLMRASGEIVAWLNSDDFYLPSAVTSAVRAFQAHPAAGLVYGDTVAVDEKGEAIYFPRYAQWSLEDLLTFHILGQPAVFMRREVLLQAGLLDPSFHFLLDHHLWIRMAALAPMVYIPQRWAAGRFHAEAKNIARAAQFGEEAFRILEWAESHPLISGAWRRVSRQSRAAALRLNGRYLLDAGRAPQAFSSYWRSLVLHPPTALVEWKRILFSLLSLIGLGVLQKYYNRWRKAQAQRRLRSESKQKE